MTRFGPDSSVVRRVVGVGETSRKKRRFLVIGIVMVCPENTALVSGVNGPAMPGADSSRADSLTGGSVGTGTNTK